MNSFKYLKLEIRLSQFAIKIFLILSFILVVLSLLFKDFSILGIFILNFNFYLFALLPFSEENRQNSKHLYYLFPNKISNFYLGRYLFLFSLFLYTTFINLVLLIINSNKLTTIAIIISVEGILFLISIISYYFKFTFNFKSQLYNFFYLIIILILSNINNYIDLNYILFNSYLFDFIKNNNFISLITLFLIILFISIFLIHLSLKNCTKKEITN